MEKLFAVGCQFNGEPYVGIVAAGSAKAAAELAVRNAHDGLMITWVQSVGTRSNEVKRDGMEFGGWRQTKVSVKTTHPKPTTVVRLDGWM